MPEVWDESLEPSPGMRETTPAENNAAAFGVGVNDPVWPPEEPITNEDGEVLGEVPLDGMGRALAFPDLATGEGPLSNEEIISRVGSSRVKPVIVTWQVYPFENWESILDPDIYQAQQEDFRKFLAQPVPPPAAAPVPPPGPPPGIGGGF